MPPSIPFKQKGKNPFVYVGPRLSLTANNADQWICVPPGDEYLIAVGLLKIMLDEGLDGHFLSGQKAWLTKALHDFPLDRISQKTGVPVQVIRDLALRFSRAERPLALAEGLGLSGPKTLDAAVAANLLCLIKPGTKQVIDFSGKTALGQTTSLARMKELSERMKKKEIDLLLLGQVNPAFTLPFSAEFQEALKSVPQVVSFSSYSDETSRLAHLVLPRHTFLESWGDYSPRQGVFGLMQPVMGPVFQTRHLGDVLISSGKKIHGENKFPWKDFYQFLKESWVKRGKEMGPDHGAEEFWEKAMERGGVWEEKRSKPDNVLSPFKSFPLAFPAIEAISASASQLDLTIYPTVQFFDGREANRPWIQELPDPMTQITWDGWLEIHPETAKAMGIQKGDVLLIRSAFGSREVPAYPIPTVPLRTVAMPIGQGHWNYGRFADGHPANPLGFISSGHRSNLRGVVAAGPQSEPPKAGQAHPHGPRGRKFFSGGPGAHAGHVLEGVSTIP